MTISNHSAMAASVLAGKRILVTGVLTPKSIAFAIAAACQAAGAEIALTSFGRAMSLTQRSALRLSPVPHVFEMDAVDTDQVAAVASAVKDRWGGVDSVVHAIGYAPEDCLGGNFMETPWESVATAIHVSSFSMKTLAREFSPLMPQTGGAMLALTFDATVAWPLYDWMGPTKAALESIVRYLARDLGDRRIRVNTIAAGPLNTIAARAVPGFEALRNAWADRSPLHWDTGDAGPVADAAVFLLSLIHI